MLSLLGQDEVSLLTNNPRKVAALDAEGVRVSERVPLRVASNAHNHDYLQAKRLRSGHEL
jgi:GTP cyclohydrolase II